MALKTLKPLVTTPTGCDAYRPAKSRAVWVSRVLCGAVVLHPLGYLLVNHWEAVGCDERRKRGNDGDAFRSEPKERCCLKRGLPPDIDVYDAAAWSAPTPREQPTPNERRIPGA